MNRRTLLAVIAITLTAACDQATSPVAPTSPTTEVTAAVAPGVTTYSGRATAINATILGKNTKKCDTGPLPPAGGYLNNSYPSFIIPGVLNVGTLYCHVRGQNRVTQAEAGIFHFLLTTGGNFIYADVLPSMARAWCVQELARTNGHAHIVRLIVNGQQRAITGSPNQTINLPNGYIRINEQTGFNHGVSAAIDVIALRVVINGVANLVFSQSHADIECSGPA